MNAVTLHTSCTAALASLALAACSSTPAVTHQAIEGVEAPASPGSTKETPARDGTAVEAVQPTSASAAGHDEPPAGLLDTLLANGALTEAQVERLERAEPSTAATPPSADEAPKVSVGSKGFWVKSADGESSIKVGGRVQTDANVHSRNAVGGAGITDGTELRRARIEMKGSLPNHLKWAAEVDFANNVARIKDFWVGRKKGEGPEVTFGHQKQPFSLEVEMSSNDIPFVERGVDLFLLLPFVDRAVGLRVQDHTDSTFYALGVYGESVSPVPTDVTLEDEGWGATGRFIVAPVQEEEEVLHLGVRGSYREPQNSLGLRIRDETTNMSNLRVVDTGFIMGVDSVLLYGPEAMYVNGPWSVGGEFNAAQVFRDGQDYEFKGWHAQATYSLTGESMADAYRMSAGEFKRLEGEEGMAWEVGARLANLDLNSGGISGGEEDVASLTLNCYYSDNLRFLLNWSHIMETSGGSTVTAEAEGLNVFTFRAQLNF